MVNRLKNALWLIVGAVVAVWAVTSLVGLVRAGPMDPPGPPGGTMKTLIAVEPRTAIWQPGAGDFPIIIDQPGSYYLGENITGEAGKDGIHIRADNVTLDLNGFTLKGAEGGASFNGIAVPLTLGNVNNLAVYNGVIEGWGGDGICGEAPCGTAARVRVSDVRVMSNGGNGLSINGGVVTRVRALGNTLNGIACSAGDLLLSDCDARENQADGIHADGSTIVERCHAGGNRLDGIDVAQSSLVKGNVAEANGVGGGDGIHVRGSLSRVEGNEASVTLNGAGIYVEGGHSRVEANDVQFNTNGGIVTSGGSGGNLIIKNSASINFVADYATHATDTVGPIIVGPVNPIASTNPWANFSY
jgi:hypothetical protein